MPDSETQAPKSMNEADILKDEEVLSTPGHTIDYLDAVSTRSSVVNMEQEANIYNLIADNEDFQYYPGTERENYDIDIERQGINKTNIIESIAHVIKGTLGAGVMMMHEAFMIGGIWTSLATVIFLGLLNFYAMYLLGTTAHIMYRRTRILRLSYPDLAELAAATGPWKRLRRFSKGFRYSVDFCLISCMGGTCCIYQIMIAQTVKLTIEGFNIDLSPWLNDDIRLYIACIAPLLMCFCLIRSLKLLAPFSMISDILVAICVLTTLYYSLQTDGKLLSRPAWKSGMNFLKLIGVCVYSTCGIGICLPVENNMRKPRQFPLMVGCAMLSVTVLTGATGFFGYWGWGESCKSPITVHMPGNLFTTVLQMFLGLMLCVTFSVQFWVPFRIFWHYLARQQRSRSRKMLAVQERAYRAVLVMVVTCVAVAFPTLVPLMAFIGHFFLGFIAFIFPAVIEWLVTWREDRRNKVRWRWMKNLIMILFGAFLSCTAFHFDSSNLFMQYDDD